MKANYKIRGCAKIEMIWRYEECMKVTQEWGMSKSFLGRILDMMPMTEEEEAQTVLNICRGLRALGMEQDRALRSRYEDWSLRSVDTALSNLRIAINKDFRESWFKGDLSSDGREAWYLHECETEWEG